MRGNIIGEGFDGYVKDQIRVRQEKLGKTIRSDEDTVVWNSSTPWVRLASSVNITSEDSKVSEILGNNFSQYKGNQLAKNFVLFNGISDSEGKMPFGVATSNGLNLNKSYGFGGLDNGLVPLPGIESIHINSYNRGSLRKADIKLKAWNPIQFYIIDILYMRVGFTILLEWGHSLYFNNDSKFEKNSIYSTNPFEDLFKPNPSSIKDENKNNSKKNKADAKTALERAIKKFQNNPEHIDQYSILESIEKERSKRHGNYDGFFGKITNFSWNLNPNGSYDINISAISVGDVIESLKTNISLSNEITDDKTSIIPNANKNILSKLLSWGIELLDGSPGYYNLSDPEISNISAQLIWINPKSGEKQYYIKLGILLKIIQEQILLYDKSNNGKTPLIKIDYDFDKNLFLTVPYQFSSDYNVCLVPFTKKGFFGNNDTEVLYDKLLEELRIPENEYAGKLMHIHVNMLHVSKILDENIDEDGKVSLLTFLETLMVSIQKSLGNINKFTVSYDADTNYIKIMDDNPIPYLKLIPNLNYDNNTTIFNINGVKYNSLGSFINNVDLKSEISNDMATTIAVGAQANGNVVGENATAFSKWNKGLIDRIIPEKISSGQENQKDPFQSFVSNVSQMYELVESIYINGDWNSPDNINTLSQLYTDNLNFFMGFLSQENKISPPGFIPFNLGLSMRGISGIKLYQTFGITQNLLPPTYVDNIRFIIKNVDHSVDSNGWITKIQSLSTGAEPTEPYSGYKPINEALNNIMPTPEAKKIMSSHKCGNSQIFPIPPLVPHKSLTKAQEAIQKALQVNVPLAKSIGKCSIYTYNHADNFVKALKSQSLNNKQISGKGDARELKTRNFLQSIGYSPYQIASSVSKPELQNLINSIKYNIGDILVYAANDEPEGGQVTYGHIQIFNGTKWDSDFEHSSFVYKNYSNNCWDLYLLRAPIIG
jgi:hypothetical protein